MSDLKKQFFQELRNMILTMDSREGDSQVMNTCRVKAQAREPSYVLLWSICFPLKNYMRSLGITHWLTDLNFLHTIPCPEQQHPTSGHISMISRLTKYWFQKLKETGPQTEIIPIFMVSCLILHAVWQICTRDGPNL